ncbi:restriction endonuclease subunit S [Romboutsia lituseburensis]|uniref:restriction endonuclease subunit S n=1 Tax=Romboutsia lituseburensis TaxID=1537 RepID=UPI0022EB448D|nr:restriction endonuclease subunit S [Romboutsia lituseburensis]
MAKKKLTLEDVLVPKEEIPYEVPENWCWVKLKGIANIINGDRGKNYPSKNEMVEEGIPFINAGALKEGKIDTDSLNYITNSKFEVLNSGKVQQDDILYCLRGTIGKNAYIEKEMKGAIASSLCIIRVNGDVHSKYIFYLLNSQTILTQQNAVNNGTAQPNLSAQSVKDYMIPLPPLAEQVRIVNRIDSLFDKVDKASELVDEARDGFEKRRAAILERAFCGELTKKWREENKVSDIDEVINKLNETRDLNKVRPIKNKDEVELGFKIPNSWRRVILHDIARPTKDSFVDGPFGSNLKTCDYTDEGVRLIQLQNIGVGFWKDDNKKYISDEKAQELSRCIASPGDIAIAKMAAPVARATIVPENEEKYVIVADCIKISVDDSINTNYVMRCINSPRINEIAERLAKGSTRKRINLGDLKIVPIPLPPREEQDEIVCIVDKLLEKEDEIESLTSIFENVDIIKKSILAKAFRGELGSNHLDDESSLNLLKELVR